MTLLNLPSNEGLGNNFAASKKVEIVSSVFVTTGTTVEVATTLTTIDYAIALVTSTPTANDVLSCDKAITTGAVTVTRPASGSSAATFDLMLIGS